jgi:indolepyruvate ferredoxin oxidoreductase alpha subunit
MTGGQTSAATGRIEDIVKGLGVEEEHVHILNPMRRYHDENMKIIQTELNYDGVSVIIPRRECIQTIGKHKKEDKAKEAVK